MEPQYPLQQIFFIPWRWNYLGQHRRESTAPRSRLATLYRLYWFVAIDLGLHLVLQLLVKVLNSARAVRFCYRHMLGRLAVRGWRVVDKSHAMLIMEHELFRHIEIELFVRRSKLRAALDLVRHAIQSFSGNAQELPPDLQEQLQSEGLWDELVAGRGSYTHHYAICIRRVLPDETLVSMACGEGKDYFAISLISYARPCERQGFFRFAGFISRAMVRLFAARPHWGKVCPLQPADVLELYPNLEQFQAICKRFDPESRFANSWIRRILRVTNSLSEDGSDQEHLNAFQHQ